MFDVKNLINNVDEMIANVKARNLDIDVIAIVDRYKKWLTTKQHLEALQQQANDNAKKMKNSDSGTRAKLKIMNDSQ